MVYYTIKNHRNQKVAEKFYFDLNSARSLAKRMIGKYKKSNKFRGDDLKIVKTDTESNIYQQDTIVEWFHSA